MKQAFKPLLIFVVSLTCTLCSLRSKAQNVPIYADTTKLQPLKLGAGNELRITNSTKNIAGFLFNYGNGNTKFKVGVDSVWSVDDTLKVRFTDNSIFSKLISSASSSGTLQDAYDNSITAGDLNPTIEASAGGFIVKANDQTTGISSRNLSTGNFYNIYANPFLKNVKITAGINYFSVTDSNYITNLSSGPGYVLMDVNGDKHLTMQPLEIPAISFTWRVRDSVCERPSYDLDDGDKFLICPSPTIGEEFEDQENNIAIYHADADTFEFQIPSSGNYLQNSASGAVDKFDGVDWIYQNEKRKLTNGGEDISDDQFASFGTNANKGAEIKTNGIRRWFFQNNGQVTVSTAPATYSTGSYDVIVRNQTTKRLEKIASTSFGTSYSAGTGLTLTGSTFSNDLSTGISGVQTLIGSTSTNSGLNIRATSGVGTTGADIVFQTGNNGATEAGRINNSGHWQLGGTKYLIATGDPASGVAVRIGNDNASDGLMNIYNTSSTAKSLQYGGVALFVAGGYDVVGEQNTKNLGTALSASNTETFRLYSSSGRGYVLNNFGIGVANPSTAKLVIAAGSTSANTAPIRLTSGSLNTTAVGGQYEYNNWHYLTNSSGLRFGVGGIIANNVSTASNSSTTETDLYSYTTPANTFQAAGQSLHASYGLSLTNTTPTKEIKIYFGGQLVFTTGALTISANADIVLDVDLMVSSGVNINYMVRGYATNCSQNVFAANGTITITGITSTNILKITGTAAGTGAASSQITAKMGIVEWKNLANN